MPYRLCGIKNRTDDVDLIFGREIYGSRNAALKLIKQRNDSGKPLIMREAFNRRSNETAILRMMQLESCYVYVERYL
jgi:hypothetical protein